MTSSRGGRFAGLRGCPCPDRRPCHALSAGLRRDLEVREPERGTVTVTVRIPPVLGLQVLGHTSATARFRPQE